MTASELPHQLAPHLRRQRFSGILDTLEVRTRNDAGANVDADFHVIAVCP